MIRHAVLLACAGLLWTAQAQAETLAVTGGRVLTLGPRGAVEPANVIVEDGRIAAVGPEAAVPAGATVIDATGKIVTPGMFDPHGQLGVIEISLVEETVDAVQSDPRYTASFEVADAINPRSTLIPINRIEGVTRAMAAPAWEIGSGPEPVSGPVTGLGTVFHLGSTEDYIVAPNVALFAVLGEHGAALAGGARGNVTLRLTEALEDARDYQAHRSEFEAAQRRDYSVSRKDLEALVPVLDGERLLVVEANRASDLAAVVRLAAEWDIRLAVSGGVEAWMVADKLAAAEIPVILDPTDNLPGSFEMLGATMENAARLHAAGVVIAFSTDETHNARNMRQLAGNAVAYGLPWQAALEAITLNPARIYGLEGELGSLEPGKAADLVVWDGDPLELTSFPERVVIAGRDIPMVSRATLLRDRYRDLGRPWPPAYRP